MTSKTIPSSLQRALALALVCMTAIGCGKQSFRVTTAAQAQGAPGFFSIPPKVDILVGVDNSGSAIKNPSIQGAINSLMSKLDSQNWDYRIASFPLVPKSDYAGLVRIAANHHDKNWGTDWVEPFPGADIQFADEVDPARFIRSSSFDPGIAPYQTSSLEPGFETLKKVLNSEVNLAGQTSKFLRSDALLLVIFISTGDDTSGVNYYVDPYGTTRYKNDGSKETSFATYREFLLGLKAAPGLVRAYSATAVSSSRNTNGSCWGPGSARVGERYIQLASLFGGKSVDICSSGAISSLLSDAASQLDIQKLSFRTQYLMLSERPEPSTIVVTKVMSDGSKVVLPQNATNGWTYVDSPTPSTVPVIDQPILMNYRTGWPIKLNGTAKMIGNERGEVEYKPYGARDS